MSPGKAKSGGNAITHGLTANILLPDVLGPGVLHCHLRALRTEWQPSSPTQAFLVQEMARHAAALDLVEQAEAAVLRSGARSTPELLIGLCPTDTSHPDTVLAAAVSSDALDRLIRYRRSHEKGWYAAMVRLREIKAREQAMPTPSPMAAPVVFATEAQCLSYLITWVRRAESVCPRCGHPHGYRLDTRERWQCARCGRQMGLRAGTVMERSRLPLLAWYRAIQQVLINPLTETHELATRCGMHRLATVRRTALAIRQATASPRARNLLAGLDRIFRPSAGGAAGAASVVIFSKRTSESLAQETCGVFHNSLMRSTLDLTRQDIATEGRRSASCARCISGVGLTRYQSQPHEGAMSFTEENHGRTLARCKSE